MSIEVREPFYTDGRMLGQELGVQGWNLITEVFAVEPEITDTGVRAYEVNDNYFFRLAPDQIVADTMDAYSLVRGILDNRASTGEAHYAQLEGHDRVVAELSLWRGLREAFEALGLTRQIDISNEE